MHTKNNEEIIIEVNDGSMGLMYEHQKEDNLKIRNLVLSKMNQHYCNKK